LLFFSSHPEALFHTWLIFFSSRNKLRA
jgi:hypothetical protein